MKPNPDLQELQLQNKITGSEITSELSAYYEDNMKQSTRHSKVSRITKARQRMSFTVNLHIGNVSRVESTLNKIKHKPSN